MFRCPMDCLLLHLVVILVITPTLCSPTEETEYGKTFGVQDSEEEKEYSPESIQVAEKHFLNLLGLKRKPRRRRGLHVPDYMWNLYHSWSNNDATDVNTNIVRVLQQQQELNKNLNSLDGNKGFIRFNLTQLPFHEKIRRADLHVYKRMQVQNVANMPPTARQATLKVFHGRRPGNLCKRRKRKQVSFVSSRVVDLTSSTWEVFNVTRAVNKWLKRPNCMNGFFVKLYRNNSDITESTQTLIGQAETHGDLESNKFLPFLVLHFDDGSGERRQVFPPHMATRVRRYVDNSPELPGGEHRVYNLHQTAKRETCRRRQMYLNFGAVGWNEYIIAPAGYDVFFCGGICPKPLGPHLNTTNHAVIQNQVNSFDPNLAPPPCCVPTSLGDVTILFLDEHYQMTLKNYKNMVALGCGCR